MKKYPIDDDVPNLVGYTQSMLSKRKLTIPRLCKNSNLLLAAIVAEVAAIVITLLTYKNSFYLQFSTVLLYLLWCTISITGSLCILRKWINTLSFGLAVIVCILICMTCFMVTEVTAQYALGILTQQGLDTDRLIRFGSVALIVSLLLLRSFSFLNIVEKRNVAEIEMTMQALQARIKPHFLFNCLNTISELSHRDSNLAEQAIDSLALLFRAGIESDKKFHSLELELNLCNRYVDLERWRLESRLKIEWNIDINDSSSIEVPKLILQPLVENAITHGVMSDGSINVKVDVRETKQDVSLMIENENETDSATVTVAGNGIAVNNIKERLFVLYDDKQVFKTKSNDDYYRVIIRFPKHYNDKQRATVN